MVDNELELRWLREFKDRDAVLLMQRYGAHSLGIGRRAPDDDEDQRLALLFYLDPGGPERGAAEDVPPALEYLPEGQGAPVELATRVVESPRAEFE